MSKRSAGDGSLYYRADKGLWVAQHQGVYRYSKEKDKARAKLHELLTQSVASKPDNITVGTLLDQWLEFAAPNLKPASIKRYSEIIRIYIKPALGQRKLSSLTAYPSATPPLGERLDALASVASYGERCTSRSRS